MAARNRSTKGTIYFILDQQAQSIKIGFSTNVGDRLSTLQTASANRLILLGTRPGSMMEEARIHAMFKDTRKSGEWFAVSNHLVEFIDKHTTVTDEHKALKIVHSDEPIQPQPIMPAARKLFDRVPQRQPPPAPPRTEPTPLASLHHIALLLTILSLVALAVYSFSIIVVVWMPGDHMSFYRIGVSLFVVYACAWAGTRRFRNDRRVMRPRARKSSGDYDILADLAQ